MDIFKKLGKKPQIVVVTQDYSGLGLAMLCLDAGYDVLVAYHMKEGEEKVSEFDMVGENMVDKIPLSDLMEERKNYKNAYFIWDQNFAFKEADKLRAEGFKVMGGN